MTPTTTPVEPTGNGSDVKKRPRRVSQVSERGENKRQKLVCVTLASDTLSRQLKLLHPFDSNVKADEWDCDLTSHDTDNSNSTAASVQCQTESLSVHQRALITPRSSVLDLQTIDAASATTAMDARSLSSLSEDNEMPAPNRKPCNVSLEAFMTQLDESTLQSNPVVDERPRSRAMKRIAVLISIFGIAVCSSVLLFQNRSPIETNSVYVSGGGFSGFWYTLGRLDSIQDKTSKNYYCYSAGCLGVVSTLRNQTMEEMYALASGIQKKWQKGEMSRYKVVETFVDGLLSEDKGSVSMNDPSLLGRLNILTTTVHAGWFGTKTSSRTPSNLESLRTMLMQTTWIPAATGNGLFHKQHMDGAFSVLTHPACEHKLGLAFDFDLIANIVNVNIGPEKVAKLWKLGLQTGL